MANDFTINNFKGSIPRLAEHLVTSSAAVKALDCNLYSGRLSSWREPLKLRDVPNGTVTSYRFGCCWLDFPSCVDIAQGPVSCKRIFTTGHKPYPTAIEVDDDCNVTEYRLGLPCPDVAPSADVSAVGGVDKDYEGRTYAYQYVNTHGEKSSLSPGSEALNIKEGTSVLVSGWPTPDETWGVDRVRIYRSVSGFETGKESANVDDTVWLLVDEIPISDTSYIDTKMNESLMFAVENDYAPPPPAELKGMIWIESINTLAGFVGNTIYFSNNNEYHHWPHFMVLDDTITAIIENNSNVYVMTKGRPYVIEGSVKDCEHAGCRTALRLPGNYPMVGFGNKHTAKLREGVVYPSHDGLILLSGRSAPSVLTWQRYAPTNWQQLEPHSIVMAEHGSKLFAFAGSGAFIMTTPGSGEQGWDNDLHTDLSDRGVIDVFQLDTGELCLLKADGVYVWDRGEELRPHLWRSSEFRYPTERSIGACHLYFTGEAEHIKIETDGRVPLDRDVPSARVIRLPMWAHGARWTVELSGTADVSLMSIAPAMADLGR